MRLWSAESCKRLDEYHLPDRAPLIDFDFDEGKVTSNCLVLQLVSYVNHSIHFFLECPYIVFETCMLFLRTHGIFKSEFYTMELYIVAFAFLFGLLQNVSIESLCIIGVYVVHYYPINI